MKKLLLLCAALLLVVSLTSCTKKEEVSNKLTVAATLDPHSKILEFAKPILKEKHNIELEVKVLDDYYIFNKALNAGEIDANYFQHVPFFNKEVSEHKYEISNVAGIHIEPFGFYSQKIKDISELQDGATIVISNSISDHGRILSILDKAQVITLKKGVDAMSAMVSDIESNPKNIKFIEIKPELLALSYQQKEGDLVAINGNYAIGAGLNPTKDAIILEQADATNPYVNIVAVKKGHEQDKNILALIEVLKSEEVKQFISKTYSDGSVIAAN